MGKRPSSAKSSRRNLIEFSNEVVAALDRQYPGTGLRLYEIQKRLRDLIRIYGMTWGIATGEAMDRLEATAHRLTELLASLICNVNGARFLDTALCLRASIELAGALVYHEGRITDRLTEGVVGNEEMAAFNQVLVKGIWGGRFDWERWVGRGMNLKSLVKDYAEAERASVSSVQSKNVIDFVKALDQRVAIADPENKGWFAVIYALLSDIVHPSFGGSMLYASTESNRDWLIFGQLPDKEMGMWLLGAVVTPTALRLTTYAGESLSRLSEVGNSLKLIADQEELRTFRAAAAIEDKRRRTTGRGSY